MELFTEDGDTSKLTLFHGNGAINIEAMIHRLTSGRLGAGKNDAVGSDILGY